MKIMLRGGVDGSGDGGGSAMTLSPNWVDEGGRVGSDTYKSAIRETERHPVPLPDQGNRRHFNLIVQ